MPYHIRFNNLFSFIFSAFLFRLCPVLADLSASIIVIFVCFAFFILPLQKSVTTSDRKPYWHAASKHSMLHRCQKWDYKSRGIYMLTLVTADREPLLGILRGNVSRAWVEPTACGSMVEDELLRLPKDFRQLEILKYQLMPDHLHVVLFVHETLPLHLGRYFDACVNGSCLC